MNYRVTVQPRDGVANLTRYVLRVENKAEYADVVGYLGSPKISMEKCEC